MNVNPVSSTSFGMTPTQAVALANADDKDLRRVAYKEAINQVNEKKFRRTDRLLWMSVPVAAGIAAVVRNPAKAAKLVDGTVANRLSNLKTFAATTIGWGATFGIIDLTIAAKNKLKEKSKAVRKFDENHPLISLAGTVAATAGLVFGGAKAVEALSKSVGKLKLSDKTVEKCTELVSKFNKGLNESKIINKVAEGVHKLPSMVKTVTKGVIDFAPMALIMGSLVNSVNHSAKINRAAVNNYTLLKDGQAKVREVIAEAEANKPQTQETEEA